MSKKIISKEDVLQYLIILVSGFYFFLCFLHYASGRPLWLDENFIYTSLKTLSPLQLFGPLGSQAFPRVYLIAVKLVSQVSNYDVFSLRFFSLIAMIGAFFLWTYIYRKEENKGMGYFLFVLTWCGSKFMSYYAAELKQYSGEVLVAGVFALFILRQRDYLGDSKRPAPGAWLYFLMPFLVLLSYTAYFFLLIPLYNLFVQRTKEKNNLPYITAYSAGMAIAVSLSYLLDARFVQTTSGMWGYWHDYFVLTNSAGDFFSSSYEGLRNIFSRWILETKLLRHIMTCFMPFALYVVLVDGIKGMRKNKGAFFSLSSITFIILCEMYVAGILKLYPFTGARITLFVAPFIFYCIIKGIELFKTRFQYVYLALLASYIVILLSTSVYILREYYMLYKV
ncbi:MAG: hypothetical protein PHW46_05130 [Candidatus Omnitrophica bacterium]|nr:hypothetical protein [Candidatus Omnitrophota bacterium]